MNTPPSISTLVEQAREFLAVAHEKAKKPLIALDIRTGNIGRQGVMWVETTTALDALASLQSRIEEVEGENEKLRMQLVATLAGTYNVAPHATTSMCGKLDETGELLAAVKITAASLHSIRPGTSENKANDQD